MPAYTIATSATDGAAPSPLATVTPSASVGIAVTGFQCGDPETGTVGDRLELFRSTTGTTPVALTPQPLNSRSSAASATGASGWTTAPTIVGQPIILLGRAVSTTYIMQRRWIVPDPRYPIKEQPSGSKIQLSAVVSNGVPEARILNFQEPSPGAFGRWRGRRGRNAAGFFVQDHSSGFNGLSTMPLCQPGSASYRYINSREWPDPVNSSLVTFLNLLINAGPPAFDPSVVPWMPTLPERFMAAWNPPKSETARAGWTQALWAIAPTKTPDPLLPERNPRPDWQPEKSGWAGVNYLPPSWPSPTTLPERHIRQIWNPERTAWAGVNYLPPTWPTTVMQPDSFMRPAWDAPKGQLLWTPIVLVTPTWGYEMQGFNGVRYPWNPERSWLTGVPYQPPRLPISVLGMDSFGRPNWNPERSATHGIPYLTPTWPSPTTLPERFARPVWNPERSAALGIPYLPPTWPSPTALPERFLRAVWDPQRTETARAGWTQALWAVAPTRPPDGMFPERLIPPWRPQDQQVFWNPFQFALVTIPTWGYEVYGPQMMLRAAWNPERSDLTRAGWTQSLWAVAPSRPPDGVFPERLIGVWNPERSFHTWVGFQPVPPFGYELYGPHGFLRNIWNPERSATHAIPYLPPTWPTSVISPERFSRPPWAPEKSAAIWPIGPTSQVIVDPRNVAFTPLLLERFPFPDRLERGFTLRPHQIVTPNGTTIIYLWVIDD